MGGEPTAPWMCDEVAATGNGFVHRHQIWRQSSGVPAHMPLVFEHEVLSTGLDLAVGVDRLNVKNLASFEWFLRRIQLHENAVLENPTQPMYDGARHFMGKRRPARWRIGGPAADFVCSQRVGQGGSNFARKAQGP